MLFSKSFVAAAAVISPALAHSSSQTTTSASPLLGLNLYWGQYGQTTDRLSSYCDAPGVTSVSLSFVTYSPKNSAGYPGTNFAGHCGGEVYYKNPKTSEDTKLIMNCDYIKKDIQYCQAKGIKVLLAIGGYCPTGGPCSYDIDSEQDGHEFGDLLHKTFGPYDQGWNGPRPFDISETEHIAVDGFDFDLEFKYPDQKPWIKMVEKLRSCGIYHISAAPQCPTSDTWFQLKELIYNAQFDSLFIQFYNNPGCQITDTPNYDDWETVISQTSKSKDAKLYIGVLASVESGWNGYAPPSTIKDLICKYQSKPHFGGVSIWDATRGAINQINGQSFHEAIADALKYGCNPIPAKTSTISISTSTSSVISSTSTSSAIVSTTSASSSSSSSSATSSSSQSASASVSASASASASIPTSVSVSASASASGSATGSASVSGSASGSASASGSGSASASASVSASASASVSASSSASASASLTFFGNSSASATGSASSRIITSLSSNATATASASATKSATVSDTCDEDDEDFPTTTAGNSHTATATATGSADATKTASGGVTNKATGSATGSATRPAQNSLTVSISDKPTGTKSATESAKNTLSVPEQLTTSTVFTTKITTVTSCKPDVPCTKGQVVTETVPWYTTVCPITATSSAVAVPTISPPPQWVTSTVFTTKTYTITSCAPDVPNCPVGQVTTKVVPAYTTVCPYTETTPGSTKPSGDVPNPPKPTGDVPKPTGGQGGNKPSGDIPQPPKPTGDAPNPTGSQGGNKPSGDVPQPPKPTGDAPKPTGSQGGSKPSGSLSPPKPTVTPVVPGKEDDSTTFIYKTLTVPVTIGKYNSTLAGTGSNYKPTSTGGFPSYTTAAPVPSKPVQAGAAKIGAFGVGGFAALAVALLL
ncbi:endochitinase [Colletotrichum melonis]|uniref:chitinase n=1 Tax=Colletotrichum melonis TaxID=1209925 RepID=A0AAI9XF72_9PEZI|nr:endochitinase [Colletotrichum melonis]